jgi:hypothetical protein
MTREQAIEIARKIPVDGTLKEAVDAVLAIDRAAREECLTAAIKYGYPLSKFVVDEEIRDTMEEK